MEAVIFPATAGCCRVPYQLPGRLASACRFGPAVYALTDVHLSSQKKDRSGRGSEGREGGEHGFGQLRVLGGRGWGLGVGGLGCMVLRAYPSATYRERQHIMYGTERKAVTWDAFWWRC